MRPKFVKEIIANSLKDPENAPPLFIEGPPGVGKSACAHQVCEEKNEAMIAQDPKKYKDMRAFGWLDTRASQHDPTDFRGIPAVIDNRAKWLAPEDIPFVGNDLLPEYGLWFLDEITSSPPLVQAVLYQATLDHRIGEHPLKPGWYTIAAGNRIEDRAVTYPMSSALANRFTHINFDVYLDDWVDWAADKKVNPNVIMFLKWKPDFLFKFDRQSSEKAFCSPRTWDFAARHIAMTPAKLLPEVLNGTVGKGATAEFLAFLKLQTKLPDIKTIFDGSDFVPKEADLTYALVGALATHAKTVQQFERMIVYSKKLSVEFSVLLVQMLAKKDQHTISKCPSFEKWAIANSDIIRKGS